MQKTLAQQNAQRGRTLRLLRKIHGWLGLWGAILGLLFGLTGFLLNHRAVLKIPAAHMEESDIQLSVPQPYPQDAQAFAAFVQQALDIRHAPLERKPRKGDQEKNRQQMGVSPASAPNGVSSPDKAEVKGKAEVQSKVQSKAQSKAEGKLVVAGAKDDSNMAPSAVTQEKSEHLARFMGRDMHQPAKWEVEFRMPQLRIRAEYIAGNQFASIHREEANAWAYIMNMHKGVGANVAWVLLADTIAGAMIVLSITGVLLWTKMRGSRLVMAGLVSGSLILTIWAALGML